MESMVRMKKSLRRPISKLTSCVSGGRERRLCAKPRAERGRGGGGRGGCRGAGRSPPVRSAHHKDSSFIQSYRADLEKERKQREVMNAQKNAERAAMRAHFRSKYQLSENPKDINRQKSVGGKVSLSRELSKIIHPEAKGKDEGFHLLKAFQGLSLDSVLLTGSKHNQASSRAPARGDCGVM